MKNEEGNVVPLLTELADVLESLGSYEIIVVDDGSTDGTWAALQEQKRRLPTLRLVKFDRNYGQSAALWAGFKRVRGRIVITMDGDMQSDPCDIARMSVELEKGADVCLTYRVERQDSWARRFQSLVGNGMRNRLLRSDIRDTGSQLRAFHARCLENLPHFIGMHRFIGNLFLMCGRRVVQIPTRHRRRHAGAAKYGMGNRMWRGLKDLLAVRWMAQRTIRYKVEHEDD
jgi:glycosyltransferase involved in cell wall biosynthesis